MKSFSLAKVVLVSFSVATLLACVAQAGPRAADKKSRLLDQKEEERYVLVTGSHIPQKVKVKSIGTATPYNLRIYTHRELERTGRSTPGAALRALDPSISFRGR